MHDQKWICIRQRAGPLVKECRYRRPTLSKADLPEVKKKKNVIQHLIRNSSFRRTPKDRLELMLALMGLQSSVYCLTFAPEFLPPDFKGVRRVWRGYLAALRRWKKKPFDYVYVIEGKHGDHRYHIHLVLRDADFSPEEIRYLWGYGLVHDSPLLSHKNDSFEAKATYFTKERTDGVVLPIGVHTWVASRSLYAKLQPPEKTKENSGQIDIPPNCRILDEDAKRNQFGEFRYAVYLYEECELIKQ